MRVDVDKTLSINNENDRIIFYVTANVLNATSTSQDYFINRNANMYVSFHS